MNKKSKFPKVKSLIMIGFSFIIQAVYSQSDSLEICTDKCMCSTDPTPAGVMISHVHEKNEWMFSYRYMNMGMNGLLTGTKSISNDDVFVYYLMSPEKMRMDMHMLMGMYGVTDRLTAMVMLNYGVNSMTMSMLPTDDHSMMNMPGMDHSANNMMDTMKTSGLGDIKLHALYGLIKSENHQLLLSTGVSFPLGNINLKGIETDMMYPNQRLPYAMQMGTGTFDFMPCINYIFQKNKLTFSTQVSSVIRPNYSVYGYKWGNEGTINTWFAYNWLKNLSSSIRFEGTILERIKGYDPTVYYLNELSANPFNYGGEKVTTYIGSTFQFKNGFMKNSRIGVEYGLPIYQSVNGMQMKLTQSIFASLSYML
jgi:hypothetical protein